MTTKHTPTPWGTDYTGTAIYESQPSTIGSAQHLHIAVMVDGDTEARQANAAFIVRACNAHEELVAALNEYIDEFEGDLTPMNPRYARAREALAKANGEA